MNVLSVTATMRLIGIGKKNGCTIEIMEFALKQNVNMSLSKRDWSELIPLPGKKNISSEIIARIIFSILKISKYVVVKIEIFCYKGLVH